MIFAYKRYDYDIVNVLYNNKEDMESPVIKIIEKKSTDDIIPDKIDLLKEKKFKIIKTINSVR